MTAPDEAPSTGQATAGLFRVTARTVAYKIVSSVLVTATTIITARQLGPSGRGVLVLYVTIPSLALLVCTLGVNASARLLLVDPVRPVALGDYLGLCAALTTAQVVVCGLLGAVLLPIVHVSVSAGDVLLLGLVGASLQGQYLLFDTLNAYGLITTAAAIEAVGGAAQLAAVATLAVTGVRQVEPFILAIAGAGLVQCCIDLAVLARRRLDVRVRYERRSWRRLVERGLPGVAVNIGQLLAFRVDRYIVGLFLTPAAVGVYSVASTAPELLRLPTMALGQPVFHRLASGEARCEDFRRSRALCLLVTALLCAVTALVAPIAVRLVFGTEFSGAVTPLRILLLGEIGIALYYLDGSALYGLGRLGDVAVAAAVGVALAVVADLLLVPTLGIAGAAWASVPAYSAMGFVATRFVDRRATEGRGRLTGSGQS